MFLYLNILTGNNQFLPPDHFTGRQRAGRGGYLLGNVLWAGQRSRAGGVANVPREV